MNEWLEYEFTAGMSAIYQLCLLWDSYEGDGYGATSIRVDSKTSADSSWATGTNYTTADGILDGSVQVSGSVTALDSSCFSLDPLVKGYRVRLWFRESVCGKITEWVR